MGTQLAGLVRERYVGLHRCGQLGLAGGATAGSRTIRKLELFVLHTVALFALDWINLVAGVLGKAPPEARMEPS